MDKTACNASNVIGYDKHGFIIHGKHEFLIGGEFHYFKTPAALWEDRLQKISATGANLLSVYIAWNLHEPVEGEQRWDGDYDLDRFLALCEKYRLYVLIKPGPYICAELDFGGHPDWMITKVVNKEFRIRMLDKGYLDLCRYWYESCARQINRHLITNGGCIIAAQLENEYDHLIEYGEETITVDDAIEYFFFLKKTMEDLGINVPKFANEAEFLRGKGIIDTRTYYPNIPGLWMWEFERFEEKLLNSKTAQDDSPVMILELQAGWFSQIGAPSYIPGLDVVEGVSKSVFITNASVVNYYMLAGGTMPPYMGARGDVVISNGLGNITSYDFGEAPIRESGEIHKEKYYWIKGFIRFAKEFSHIISGSDGKRHAQIVSGGENIALLGAGFAEPDSSLDKAYENFTTYEEGNEEGRFFFARNAEDDEKRITVKVSASLTGTEHVFSSTLPPRETRIFPIGFKAPGADLLLGYSTSEVLLSKKYESGTALVLSGKKGAPGETLAIAGASGSGGDGGTAEALRGDISVHSAAGGLLLKYVHGGISIVKIGEVYIFIIDSSLNGRIEELGGGLLFHNVYYLQEVAGEGGEISLSLQVKDNTDNFVSYFPLGNIGAANATGTTTGTATGSAAASPEKALLDGERLRVRREKSGMLTVPFAIGDFTDGPEFEWTSGWKYTADSWEAKESYDHSSWRRLEKPMPLEQAGLLEHGYIWYRAQFELSGEPEIAFMDYMHNDTDRYLVYLNGELVYRSRFKSICQREVTQSLRQGRNTIAVLYANEFHNKSHPHEGEIIKLSGIMSPFVFKGKYKDGSAIDAKAESFYVKQGLRGIAEGFTAPSYDDSWWDDAPEAEKYVIEKDMGLIVWFRRRFRYRHGASFIAPLKFVPGKADERLTFYINGRPLGRYDVLGPQEDFYIPDPYVNKDGENAIAIILECPGFYEEIMSGFRRGYMHNPIVTQVYTAKRATLRLC